MSLALLAYRFIQPDGTAAAGFQVHINVNNSDTPASIYATSNPASILGSNVLIADVDGKISCYVDDASNYTIAVYYPVGNVPLCRVNDVDPTNAYAIMLYGASGSDLDTDKEFINTQFEVVSGFTGASVGDIITSTRLMDVNETPPAQIGTTQWFNNNTGASLSTPNLANLAPVTSFGTKITASTALGVGGRGVIGWLSDIRDKIVLMSAKLPAALGIATSANSLSVAPASDSEFSVKSVSGGSIGATVSAAASLSGSVNLGVKRAGSVLVPADVGGATSLTFQASFDGVTFGNVYDQFGSEYRVTIPAVSTVIVLDPFVFATFPYVKIRFGTSASPTSYANQRDVVIGLRV